MVILLKLAMNACGGPHLSRIPCYSDLSKRQTMHVLVCVGVVTLGHMWGADLTKHLQSSSEKRHVKLLSNG